MSAVPKLRFPEFDGEWVSASLQELSSAKISYGVVQPGKEKVGGVPFIRGGDFPHGVVNKENLRTISNDISETYSRTRVKGDEILVSLVGYPGSTALTDAQLRGANIARQVALIRPKDEASRHFIFQFLRSPFGQKQMLENTLGSALQVINLQDLRQTKLGLPSLPEQQKIAAFLSSVDKKIDLLRQKKDALELYKKGLMQKIFSQEIRFKQDDGSDFPDWEEVTVGDMAERHVKGLTSSTLNFVEKGYPVYGASGVIGYIDNYLSEQRYIGVVKDGAGVGRVFEAVEQSSLLSTMESIIPKSGFSFGFVKQVIKDIDFKKFTTGSTIPHVYFKDYSKESYPCPAYEEQERIAHLLDLFDAKIQNTSSQIEQMETFKKGLLQQMFV